MAKNERPPNFEHYQKLVATLPGIECKGATTGYTAINGNMFTFLSKNGELGIRLGKEDYQAFIDKYDATEFIQYGAVMREYVQVPSYLIPKLDELKPYFEKSLKHAKTLKPKN